MKKKKKKDKRHIVSLLWGTRIAICNFSVDWSIEFSGLVGTKKYQTLGISLQIS